MPEISTQTIKPKNKTLEAQIKAYKKYKDKMKAQGISLNYNKQENNRYNQYKFQTLKMIKYLFNE